jgi:hypothetical protein
MMQKKSKQLSRSFLSFCVGFTHHLTDSTVPQKISNSFLLLFAILVKPITQVRKNSRNNSNNIRNNPLYVTRKCW